MFGDSAGRPGRPSQEANQEEWRVYCALYPLNDYANGRLHPTYHRKNEPSTWIRPDELPIEVASAQFGRALALWADEHRDVAAAVLAREPNWSFDRRGIDQGAEAEQEEDARPPSR